MFLREIQSKGKTYLAIVESYYKDKCRKHRLIASLGCVDNYSDNDQLSKIAISLLKYCKNNKTHYDITTLQEKNRRIWGIPVVIRRIWNIFKFDELFEEILDKRKIKYDVYNAVFLMLLDRISDPKSKLKSYEKQDRYIHTNKNELHHLYRALDILCENKDKIENYLYEKNVDLFNLKIDIVLYDVTTLYFESTMQMS